MVSSRRLLGIFCSVVLTILSTCSIIQQVGPCFHVIMGFIESEEEFFF